MPTKISLALGPKRALSRQTAWGCLTSNVAVPGTGSLAAGRAVGYPQLGLSLAGLAVSLLATIRLGLWLMANWDRLHGPEVEPLDAGKEMLLACRWPILGIAIFAGAWLWALATSLTVLREAKAGETRPAPPRLH